MIKKVFYSLFVFFLVYSCGINEKEIKIQDVVPDKSISSLSDSSYFSDMQSLVWSNDRLLSSEIKRSQVFVMDKDMKLISTIGKFGRGPQEMSNINYFYVYKDTIVINDPGNDRIQFFDFVGNHLGYITGLSTSPAIYIKKFVYQDSSFIATSKTDSAIIIHNSKTGNVKKFGKRYQFNSEFQNRIRNDRYILKKGNKIISISDNQPFIESYNYTGSLLERYDYSNIDIVRKDLIYIRDKNLPENSYVVIVADCNIFKNNIFLLLNSWDDGFCCNIVMEFTYDKDIKLSNIYRLPDKAYSSIAFNGTSLFAYSYIKGELQRFKL